MQQGSPVWPTGGSGTTFVNTGFHIIAFRFDGTTAAVWLDGIQGTSVACTSGNFGPRFVLGARHQLIQVDPSDPAPIDVLEVQMHKSALTNAQMLALSNHLKAYYGI